MKIKDLKINFRYLGGNIACLSVDSISGESVHNDINNEEAIIIFNSLVGEKADCQTVKSLLEEIQKLKEHLKVPKACSLKTLEDYKSYYEDTTREQILEDTYIEYCAYVNLAHRYSELKKQAEENKDNYNCLLKQKEQFEYIMSKQVDYQGQKKEFINYLKDKIYNIEPKGTGINYNCEYDSEEDYVMAMQEQSRLNTLKEILQKYKEIIGVSDEKK